MINLCFDFMRKAKWIWERIREADEYGLCFGEETITETLLMWLKRAHPTKIHVQAFTKKTERKNGADWEWWIGRDGNWIGMRVQAKRIKLPSEQYESLFYKYDKPVGPETQIENLIEKAEQDNLIPIYALYTHSKIHLPMPANMCICKMLDVQSQALNGCLIVHAQDVQLRGSKKLSDIHPFSFPWHCLVCPCIKNDGRHPPKGPADSIFSMLRESGDVLREDSVKDREGRRVMFEPLNELPEYMQILKSGDDPKGKYLQKRAAERDIAGHALLDLGELDG